MFSFIKVGVAAGKAPYGVAKKDDANVNMNRMRDTVESARGVVNDTRNKLIERDQKLGEVEIASKQMSERAEEFASLPHKVMLKQKEKAEWQSFGSKKSRKGGVNANMNRMRDTVESACGVVNDTRNKLIERGQKLGEVEIASKQMSERAEEFASLPHKVMLKQKQKAE
ncbi:unnamed protein product [Rotaria socialis]